MHTYTQTHIYTHRHTHTCIHTYVHANIHTPRISPKTDDVHYTVKKVYVAPDIATNEQQRQSIVK